MTRRAMVGGAIIVAWIAGLAVLIRREYFRPRVELLAEAAKRVSPGVVYYGVMQGERQVGFASSIMELEFIQIIMPEFSKYSAGCIRKKVMAGPESGLRS